MKLLIFNAGADTAGVGFGLRQAFDRYAPDWEARSVYRQRTYLDYPSDIYWPKGASPGLRRRVTALIRDADVIHVMDQETALSSLAPWLNGTTVVMHHLGSRYRRDPEASSTLCRTYGATEVTDSIDLVRPGVPFLPVPADLDALAALRREVYRPSKRIRIAHAPTNRELKDTEAVIAAVESLARHYPIDFDLIERVTHRECLARKARVDIFVDQLQLGFGLNNIECWAMGIPVVSGWEHDEDRQRSLDTFGRLPWADATRATLEAVIEHLVTDPDWRVELGERGRDHAARLHSEKSVVRQTLEVYERAGLRVAA